MSIMNLKNAGIIYGPEAHHLDHIAPLCHLLNIPLIVTEEHIAYLANSFYPHIEIIQMDYAHIAMQCTQGFDILFSCMPRPLFDEIFFLSQQFLRKKVHTIWCPHGNSDKGHKAASMEGLKTEKYALIYGPKMQEFLVAKGAFENLQAHVHVGNFRKAFYQKHADFYNPIMRAKFPEKRPTILFAPTWNDAENSSSFFAAAPGLIENLPASYNLIIKPHPNLWRQEEAKLLWLLGRYEDTPHVFFLEDFPPINPLLEYTDIYIGDMSSIGYDFLSYNKPMFFLNQNSRSLKDPGLYLHRCGISIEPQNYSKIYSIIQSHLPQDSDCFTGMRNDVYQETFGPPKNLTTLKQELIELCCLIGTSYDNDLPLL